MSRKNDPRTLPISPAWPFYIRPGGMYGHHYLDLWEEVPATRQPFDGLAFLTAAWMDPRITDDHRGQFVTMHGLARARANQATVAVNGDARGQGATPEDVTVKQDDTFGSRVREFRKTKGMTLAEASEAVGVSISHLSNIERARAHATDEVRASLTKLLGFAA